MEMYEATEAFSSLSQETRLRVLKLLIEYGSDGVVPGFMTEELGIPANTLSFHLSHMSKAGLVSSKKNGRSVTYYANERLIEDLIKYLRANCCAKQKNNRSKKCKERNC